MIKDKLELKSTLHMTYMNMISKLEHIQFNHGFNLVVSTLAF